MKQSSEITRKTKETDISIALKIYGQGSAKISSGVGFLDHMLESFTKHGLLDLQLSCKGDTHIDFHHSVEDCGIALGAALQECLYPLESVERFGSAGVVMDEACVQCDLDLSNRAFLVFDMSAFENEFGAFKGKVGEFDIELVEEFFRALVFNAGISAHIVLMRGKNLHHIIEACFKAFAVALRRALAQNPRVQGAPSTKGVI